MLDSICTPYWITIVLLVVSGSDWIFLNFSKFWSFESNLIILLSNPFEYIVIGIIQWGNHLYLCESKCLVWLWIIMEKQEDELDMQPVWWLTPLSQFSLNMRKASNRKKQGNFFSQSGGFRWRASSSLLQDYNYQLGCNSFKELHHSFHKEASTSETKQNG